MMEPPNIDYFDKDQDETKNSKDPTTDLPTPTSPDEAPPFPLIEEDNNITAPNTLIPQTTIHTIDENDELPLDEGEPGPMNENDGMVGRMKTQIYRMLGRPTGGQHYRTEPPPPPNNIKKKNIKLSPTPPPAPPSPTKKYQHRPSATDNIYIDGRRYQNYNRIYALPNDDIEIDRQLNNHFLVKHSFGSNYSAPVTELLSSNSTKCCMLGGFPSGATSPQRIPSIRTHAIPTARSPGGEGDDNDTSGPLKHCCSNDSLVSGTSLTTCQTNASSLSTTSLSNYFRKLTTLGHRHKDTMLPHPSLLSTLHQQQQQQPSLDSPGALTPTMTTTPRSTTSPIATTRTTTRTASPMTSPAKSPPPLSKSVSTTRTLTSPHDAPPLVSPTLAQRRSYSENDLLQCEHQHHHQQNGNTYEPTSKRETCHVYPNINVPRVLDVGCGSGVWMLEMAHDFPNTEFYGFDLSEMFPTAIRPSNTFFCLFDMSRGFPYPDEYFDFIRMHDVHTCFPSTDTEFIMREIRRCLKPGGYAELREMDFVIFDPGPITAMLTSTDSLTAIKLQKHYGVDIKWPRMIRHYLTMTKLADVHSRVVPLIYSNHSQQDTSIDKMCYRYWNDRFDAYRRLFWQIHGGDNDIETHQKLNQQIQEMMKEMLERSSYCQYYMAWGRKPLVDEQHSNTQLNNDDDGADLLKSSNTNNNKKMSRPNIPRNTSDSYGHEITEFTDGFTD